MWQQSLYPKRYHPTLRVMHEGIETNLARPNPDAKYPIPGTNITVQAGDEVLTYIGRNLEPHRGFPSLMRSLPEVLRKRPKARVLIIGGDGVSYGPPPAEGGSWKNVMIRELGDALDWSRVHFLGKVPYPHLLNILQLSRAHVYLTYPFVLSWSMLEAMACGCLVVGSRTPPVEEVINDGENGLLVDFFSHEQIAEKIVSVLADPDAYADVRARARQTILERYDLHSKCLPAQLQLIDEICRAG